MNQSTIVGYSSLSVVNQTGLYAFEWCHGKNGFEDPCSQSRENGPRAGDMAVFIRQKVFECVEGKKSDCGLKSISGYQRGATNIIRPS